MVRPFFRGAGQGTLDSATGVSQREWYHKEGNQAGNLNDRFRNSRLGGWESLAPVLLLRYQAPRRPP